MRSLIIFAVIFPIYTYATVGAAKLSKYTQSTVVRYKKPWYGINTYSSYGKFEFIRGSSVAKGYINTLFDGEKGREVDETSTYLTFLGNKAYIKYKIDDYKKIDKISVGALEMGKNKSLYLSVYLRKGNIIRDIPLKKTIQKMRGNTYHAEYTSQLDHTIIGQGELLFLYDSADSFCMIDEITIDDFSNGLYTDVQYSPKKILTLDAWKKHNSKKVFGKFDDLDFDKLNQYETLKHLLGMPSRKFPTKVIDIKETVNKEKNYKIYEVLLHVDRTGQINMDIVILYLVVPLEAKRSLPLVVQNHQGTVFGGYEPLGINGRSELNFTDDIIKMGGATLIVEMYLHNTKNTDADRVSVYQYHPEWSTTGKEISNIQKALDYILSEDFYKYSKVKLDSTRLANVGFSYGGYISTISAMFDKRYKHTINLHTDYYSKNYTSSFAQALYLPALSYFKDTSFLPIKNSKMIEHLAKRGTYTISVVGDEKLKEEYLQDIKKDNYFKNIQVILNYYGKVTNIYEKEIVLNYLEAIIKNKKIPELSKLNQINSNKDIINNENIWRNVLIKNMTQKASE